MKKEYTREEKIAYYLGKMQAAMSAGSVAKNVFEAIYYADQVNWIFYKLSKLLQLEEFD